MSELPLVQRVHDKFRDKGLQTIGLSVDRSGAVAKKVVDEKGLTFPNVVYDGEGFNAALYNEMGIIHVPFLMIVNGKGEVVAMDVAAKDLDAEVEKLLAGD